MRTLLLAFVFTFSSLAPAAVPEAPVPEPVLRTSIRVIKAAHESACEKNQMECDGNTLSRKGAMVAGASVGVAILNVGAIRLAHHYGNAAALAALRSTARILLPVAASAGGFGLLLVAGGYLISHATTTVHSGELDADVLLTPTNFHRLIRMPENDIVRLASDRPKLGHALVLSADQIDRAGLVRR